MTYKGTKPKKLESLKDEILAFLKEFKAIPLNTNNIFNKLNKSCFVTIDKYLNELHSEDKIKKIEYGNKNLWQYGKQR